MKVVRYSDGEGVHFGALVGREISPLDGVFPDLSSAGAPLLRLDAVKLLTPTAPSKIIAIGPGQRAVLPPNYPPPDRPRFWIKPPPSCLTNPGESVEFPPIADVLTHEAEIALVIGREARRVSIAEAPGRIAGYTVHNDLTVGDPATDGATPLSYYWKSFDGCSVFGPAIATELSAADLPGLTITARVNGEIRVEGRCDLLYSPHDLVSWLSQIVTLYPGDVISMGCVGAGPLRVGDVVEAEVEGLGELRTEIIAAA